MLIADDNRQIVSVLEAYAKKEGFEVTTARDGAQALELVRRMAFDVILLDVMMPLMDGFEVCREVRRFCMTPVIMVTARGEDFERIMGLDIGADDYIVKPFSPGEVMARVRAVLRRLQPREDERVGGQVFRFGELMVNLDEFITEIGGGRVPLTKKETELLFLLGANRNKVFTRDNLLSSLWGYDYEGDARTVDSHIRRLRVKLDEAGRSGFQIATIRGVGYKFEVTP